MIRFAELFQALDETTKTNEKVAALKGYFETVASADAAWATFFLAGNKLRQLVPTKLLRGWAAESANIPDWLFDEAYHSVGDLAETLSLVVPPGQIDASDSLADWIEQRLKPLRGLDEADQKAAVLDVWRQTSGTARLVVMKLITGAFRVGVSRRLVTRAIAEQSGIAVEVIAHRLMGNWTPTSESYQRLIDPETSDSQLSQPYPFCLAHAIDSAVGVEQLGAPNEFLAEWKWDGIRGQVIRRDSRSFIWSRGEELMENRWPEIEAAAEMLPDGTVLDGEILAATAPGQVLPFAQLQRRIGRKTIGKKLLNEVPVIFHAFDLLELNGQDLRDLPFSRRRQELEVLMSGFAHPNMCITEIILESTWADWTEIRQTSRDRNAEGLMLKRKDSIYDVGRVRGTWWKWKILPHTIDAVLIYAQKGHGKRANLFTDFTFAVWNGGELIPFAKAYSGLTDAEIRDVDRFVRQNTRESFGPVRSVTPTLVMELAFEGLQRSSRHKSGIATRFPRIVRWRHDKRPEDANSLDELVSLLP